MLPNLIIQRIAQFYEPGTLDNYDSIITFDDFAKLFAPIDAISGNELNQALNDIGFDSNNMIDNLYFVLKI